MVLEGLINPKVDKVNSWKFFLVGMLYTLIGAGMSQLVYQSQSSVVNVFMVVLAIAPFMYHMLEREEIKELEIHTRRGLAAEYVKITKVLGSLFLGMTAMYAILAYFLHDSTLFSYQLPHILQASKPVAGDFLGIVMNNMTVLLICVMFSFFFGMGAIFILAMNASVLGTAIGYGVYGATSGLGALVEVIRFLPHGIFEFGAYFIAGIAGSFISFGMLHKEYLTHKFSHTLKDSALLFLISIGLLLIAGVVEVFVVI